MITPFEKLTVTMRCQGKTAAVKIVTKPTKIEIPGTCKLETDEWRISGTQQGAGKLIKTVRPISFNRTVNFTLPKDLELDSLEPFKYQGCMEIPLVDMKQFQARIIKNNDKRPSDNLVATYLSLVGFIELVILIIILVLRKFLKKRAKE